MTEEACEPIFIVKENGQCLILGSDTPRSKLLSSILLEELGGINESNPDGTYCFNAIIDGDYAIYEFDRVES